eukprot:m.256195 g.256195  ORF g.256195 m.256195 type:complete len:358 (+) comp34172_c0_seq1:111-1184(+)
MLKIATTALLTFGLFVGSVATPPETTPPQETTDGSGTTPGGGSPTGTTGTTEEPCVEPVSYHWRGVEDYCKTSSPKDFDCETTPPFNCGGDFIKPYYDDRAVPCKPHADKAEQLRLAIGNQMFGRKDSATDCSAWCLYDVVEGPTVKHWRWNNKGSKKCWDYKNAGSGCGDTSDNEKANAIAHFDTLCPLGDTIKAHPVCAFDRLIDRSGDVCWTSVGTVGKFPRNWRTGITGVGNPTWGNTPDNVRFHSWSKVKPNHDNTEAGFRALIMQDPNAFAYSKYTFSAGGSPETGYIAWTTNVYPANDVYAAYDAAVPYIGYQVSQYHGSASGICDFETVAAPASSSDIEHYALTNECGR